MLVRVIYTDQTAGVVESHLLDGLIKKGESSPITTLTDGFP